MAAPTLSASYIADLWTNSTSPRSTASINRAVGDVLVAVAVMENTDGPSISVANATGITWTLQQEVTTASRTRAQIWTAVASSAANTVITFSEVSATTLDWGARVFHWTGSDGVGVSNKGDAANSAASVTLTGVSADSAIVMAIGDWDAANTNVTYRTADAGTFTEVEQVDDGNLYTAYTGYHANAGASGNKVVGFTDTAPTWSLVAVEVKGTSSGVTGTADVVLPALTATFSGAVTVSGTAGANLPALTASFNGTVGSSVSGTVDVQLPALTASFPGTVSADGTVSVTLPVLIVTASGTVKASGTVNVALPALAVTTSGTLTVSGTGNVQLPALVASFTGIVGTPGPVTGTVDVTLPALVASLLGDATVSGSAEVLLPALTAALSGAVNVQGTADVVLPVLSVQADGTLNITGTANVTLPSLTVSVSGIVGFIAPPPDERIYIVQAENRVVIVTSEGRVYVVEAESRLVTA